MILYGNRVTPNMETAIREPRRRRALQEAYNAEHGITPTTIVRAIDNPLADLIASDHLQVDLERPTRTVGEEEVTLDAIPGMLKTLRKEMKKAASKLDFEEAAEIRDRIRALETWALERS